MRQTKQVGLVISRSNHSNLSYKEAAEANYNTGYDIAKYQQILPMKSLGLSPLRTVMEDERASCNKSLHA